jgi:SAM-dependent methyltransferase
VERVVRLPERQQHADSACRSRRRLRLSAPTSNERRIGAKYVPAGDEPIRSRPMPRLARPPWIESLRMRTAVSDAVFDSIFPAEVQQLSERHWTPVSVALRAAELVAPRPGARILDVGSGAGKFCLIAALSCRATFVGVEQRPHLVEAANRAKQALGAERAEFVEGNLTSLGFDDFDGFYFFNPFYEHVAVGTATLDETIALDPLFFVHYVCFCWKALLLARRGTRVVTYYGIGGMLPKSYRRVHKERAGTDVLELWVKR